MRANHMRATGFTVALVAMLASPAYPADSLIPVRVTLVKTDLRYKFVAKQPTPFALPGEDPTAAGGSLRILDTDNPGNTNTYALPSGNWSGLGNPAGSAGFKYAGTGLAGDPCKRVLIKPSVIKAVCKGPDITFATPLSATGSLYGVLTIGTGTRYCMACEGDVKKNQVGIFKSINCPPPPLCEP